ncbi:carbohydrate ABC transporter permease [Treponema sp.]
MNKYLFRKNVANAANYAIFGILMLFFLGPIIWMLSLSFKPSTEIFAFPPTLIPGNPTLSEYIFVLKNSFVPHYILNSMFIAVLLVIVIFVVCIPGAYGFSRFRFRGKKTLLMLVLSFQMIAPIVIVVPLYRMLNKVGLLNTHTGLILTLLGVQVPFSVWLLKGFLDSIPISLDESAFVDGASRFRVLIDIVLPSAAPGLAAVTVFNFIFGWSDYLLPSIILSSERLTPFAVGVYVFQSGYGTMWNKVAAASVLGLAPVLLMYVLLQRYFISGLTAGAVKG